MKTGSDLAPNPLLDSRVLGVIFVIGSALGFSCHSTVVSYISNYGFGTIVVTLYAGIVRFSIGTAMVPCRAEWRNNSFCRGHGVAFVWLVILRQTVGVTALACMYGSYSRMPVGEATAIIYTAPIWTTIFARFFLDERITSVNLCAAISACIGVGLIAVAGHGDEDSGGTEGASEMSDRTFGFILAVSASLLLAGMMVTSRKIGFRQPAVVSSAWYGFALILMSLPLAILLGSELVPHEATPVSWVALFTGSAISYFAQTLVIMSLQRLEAGPVNVLATLEIAFSFTWQVTLLGQPLHLLSVFGAAIIVSSAVVVTVQKMRLAKEAAKQAADLENRQDQLADTLLKPSDVRSDQRK